jgi:tetratricopeptide (TPR) repeat protein
MRPGGPIPIDRESEYVNGVGELLSAVYSRKFAEADALAARLQRNFGNAAGIHAARCDLEIRRRRYPVARAQCRDAIRLYPDSAWAHYLIGLLDKHDRKSAAAIEHLERAIALYPELKHAYQVADELYQQLGRAADRKRLAEAYRAQFGGDL